MFVNISKQDPLKWPESKYSLAVELGGGKLTTVDPPVIEEVWGCARIEQRAKDFVEFLNRYYAEGKVFFIQHEHFFTENCVKLLKEAGKVVVEECFKEI